MAYEKLNKADGDILYGADIEHMEDGIIANESRNKSYDAKIGSLTNLCNELDKGVSDLQTDVSNLNKDKADKLDLVALLLDRLYPIGYVVINTTGQNPGDTLGGVWEQCGTGHDYIRLGGNGVGGSNSVMLEAKHLPTHSVSETSVSHTHVVPEQTQAFNIQKLMNNGPVSSGTGASAFLTGGGFQQTFNWPGEVTMPSQSTESADVTHSHTFVNSQQMSIPIEPQYFQVFAWQRIA